MKQGSGKTFTISGNKLNNDDEYGIIPRAVHNIFQIISQASPVTSHRSNLNSNKVGQFKIVNVFLFFLMSFIFGNLKFLSRIKEHKNNHGNVI